MFGEVISLNNFPKFGKMCSPTDMLSDPLSEPNTCTHVVYMALLYEKQGNSKKLVMPRPAHGFVTYLMEYAFTFTFAAREFPPKCTCDSIHRPGNLDL